MKDNFNLIFNKSSKLLLMENSKKLTGDFYQEVTDKIISCLEQGVQPWKRSWGQYGLAKNFFSGNIYQGINMLLMNMTKHKIPYFISFNQAKNLGGNIRKGAKAERVFYYNTYFKDELGNRISKENAEILSKAGKKIDTISFLKYYNVFNIEDVENIEFEISEIQLNENEKIDFCESIYRNMANAPTLVNNDMNNAFYEVDKDKLNMPDIRQFDSSEAYYSTLFHELIHSTGHKSRLSRETITNQNIQFGSIGYAKEELIAEIGASFLCAYTNINQNEITANTVSYIANWLKILKNDKRFIFKSAAKASKATNYILS